MLLLESRGPGHLAEARTTKKPLQQGLELWKGSCRGRKRRKENPWPLPCPAPLLWASSASSSLSPVETQPPGPVPETQSGEVRMGSESKRAQDQHDVASMICPLSRLLRSPLWLSVHPLRPQCLLLGSQPGPSYCTGALCLGCK